MDHKAQNGMKIAKYSNVPERIWMLSLTMSRIGNILCGLLPRTAVLYTRLIVASIHYQISCLVIENFTYSMSKMDTDLSDPLLAIPFLSSVFFSQHVWQTSRSYRGESAWVGKRNFPLNTNEPDKMRHTSLSSGIPALYSQWTLYPSLTTRKTSRSTLIIKL